MDKKKRKELVQQYMDTKTIMSVYDFFCTANDTHYIGFTQNTKATINGSECRLGFGNHKIKTLQNDWNKYGKDSFNITILETLEYDKDDELKTDYSAELNELLNTWASKFNNIEIIK